MQTRVVKRVMGKEESAKSRKLDMIIDAIVIPLSLIVFMANQHFRWSPRVLFGVLILCMVVCSIQFLILLFNPNIQYETQVVEKIYENKNHSVTR